MAPPASCCGSTASRLGRTSSAPPHADWVEGSGDEGQLVLFEGAGEDVPAAAPRLRELAEIPAPASTVSPVSRTARISLHDRCGYRYYAERVVGMRPAPWEPGGEGRVRPPSDGDR